MTARSFCDKIKTDLQLTDNEDVDAAHPLIFRCFCWDIGRAAE